MFRKDIINEGAIRHGITVFTKEQERKAMKQMVQEFFGRLQTNDNDDFYWVGTQVDLMEMIYIIWQQDIVRDGFGCPSSLKALTRIFCDRLHMPEPYNLYAAARRARQRKGVNIGTLLNRYCWMIYVKKEPHPLNDEIIQLSSQYNG